MDKIRIRAANDKLAYLAQTDALTGCYSRQYVNTILVNQRDGRWNDMVAQYSMVMVDIDDFKKINDTYGHENGDRVINAFVRVLRSQCQEYNGDCVIRHGGDEFILLYNRVTKERFEEKIKNIIEKARDIFFEDRPGIHVTLSAGGEYYADSEQSTYYNQVQRADQKLYMSKESGRNRYTI